MDGVSGYRSLSERDLRHEVELLQADYTGCLDEERFEDWPDFFTDDGVYKVISRENFERGLPLGLWYCESKGYLQDRVVAIRKTIVFGPRYIRRFTSGTRVVGWTGDELEVRANFATFETLTDEMTRTFVTGHYRDRIVVDGNRLKFKEKLCVYDSLLIPNSLIYPL